MQEVVVLHSSQPPLQSLHIHRHHLRQQGPVGDFTQRRRQRDLAPQHGLQGFFEFRRMGGGEEEAGFAGLEILAQNCVGHGAVGIAEVARGGEIADRLPRSLVVEAAPRGGGLL